MLRTPAQLAALIAAALYKFGSCSMTVRDWNLPRSCDA
jgi:hypothetical protein